MENKPFQLYQIQQIFNPLMKNWLDFIETQKEILWKEIINRILLANNKNTLYGDQKLWEKINKLYGNKKDNLLYQYYKRKDIAEAMVQLLHLYDLNICLYCWSAYLLWNWLQTSTELDHYLDRNHFPQYAWNPYNLVPVCKNCNNSKSDTTIVWGIDAISYLKNTKYEVERPFLFNERKAEYIKTKNSMLAKECKIHERFMNNRNQLKLQNIYEDCLLSSTELGIKANKMARIEIREKNRKITSETYANFDRYFLGRLVDINFFEVSMTIKIRKIIVNTLRKIYKTISEVI